MSELAGFGDASWLPSSVQRRLAVEDRTEAREAKAEEQAREARHDERREAGLAAYRAGCEQRGEVVSAMTLATGQDIGRSMSDIFTDARAAGDREDARAAALERRLGGGEDVLWQEYETSRSDWPSSEYLAARMIAQADELHRARVAYMARHSYGAAEEAARSKAGR
jgi:hypothetical protein